MKHWSWFVQNILNLRFLPCGPLNSQFRTCCCPPVARMYVLLCSYVSNVGCNTVGGNNIATLGKNKAMPFLPPAEWWSSKLSNTIIKKHRTPTANIKMANIQSGRKFRPKFEVGLCFSKNARTARIALFFLPTVCADQTSSTFSSCSVTRNTAFAAPINIGHPTTGG